MKRGFLAASMVLAVVSANPTNAADAVETSAANWAGSYFGVYGEGAAIQHRFVEGAGLGSLNGAYGSWGGGVFGGHNWQQGATVYGIELSAGYLGSTATLSPVPGPLTMTSHIGANGAIKARLGRDMGNIMPFLEGGLALAHLDTFWPGGAVARSGALFGGVIGAGVDVKVTDNMFVRAAYDFTYYGNTSYEYCGGLCVMNHQLNSHSFKFGLGMKF
jgi:outer membrane immunogenic protein